MVLGQIIRVIYTAHVKHTHLIRVNIESIKAILSVVCLETKWYFYSSTIRVKCIELEALIWSCHITNKQQRFSASTEK